MNVKKRLETLLELEKVKHHGTHVIKGDHTPEYHRECFKLARPMAMALIEAEKALQVYVDLDGKFGPTPAGECLHKIQTIMEDK